jgi:hypothetical protein
MTAVSDRPARPGGADRMARRQGWRGGAVVLRRAVVGVAALGLFVLLVATLLRP